jgi:predicted MFS family arabinose efflux permease
MTTSQSAASLQPDLPRRLVIFLATCVGLIAANGYYVQPLLAELGREFALSPQKAGQIVMVTQLGTAFGMLTIVPLGDVRELKSLVTILLTLAAAALLAMATASSSISLFLASFGVGMSNSIVHLIVPFAAYLAPESSRGRVVGTVLSGLLIGVLLARTASGLTAGTLGWRGVYWAAATIMLILVMSIHRWLPRRPAIVHLEYFALLRSVFDLVRRHIALREAAITGALLFAAFSALWTTLAFLLESPPFAYGPQVTGLFGLVGACGAAGAPIYGRMTDRIGPRQAVIYALVITLIGFGIMAVFSKSLVGLIAGILVMDLGVQSGHVANQTRIYGIDPLARGRLNTAYMVAYFAGGATGSALGAFFWQHFGWIGVCGFAISVVALGLAILCRGSKSWF